MIHTLRHIAIRLWISLLAGTLIILLIVPLVPVSLDLTWITVFGLLALSVSFLLIGWLFNRWGLQRVERLIREATLWERSGNFSQAETIFRKAIAIFDSFLISPFSKKKYSKELSAHLAKFYLARPGRNPQSDVFITAYLHDYPEEQLPAEEWFQQIAPLDDLSPDQADLAFRIAEAQPENQKIQAQLARHFIAAERVDHQALQVYRRFLSGFHQANAALIAELAELFLENQRTDQWALKAYVMSYGEHKNKEHLLAGIAACLHWLDSSSLPVDLRRKAERFLARVSEADRQKMAAGFAPPVAQPLPQPKSLKPKWIPGFIRVSKNFAQQVVSAAAYGAALLFKASFAAWILVQRIRNYRHIKPFLKWGGIFIAGTVLVVLAANTVSYLLKPRPEPLKKVHAVPVVTDPFTLQVAAYLKKEQAEHYVEALKKFGLDAYWTEAQGVKTRWYQVRLSHFPTKDSARAYGERLKARRIIDDFYVANYKR